MKLTEIELRVLDIPFRVPFRHAAALRTRTESVWVVARSRDGSVGYGEACPRSYVTGETLESVRAFFEQQRGALRDRVHDLSGLRRHAERHRAEIDDNPAAWCAIELALLDLLAKENGRSVEALLGRPELDGSFRYTAIVGDDSPERVRALVDRYWRSGFTDFKLKLSGQLTRDARKLAALRAAAPGARIRVDANNCLRDPDEAIGYLQALGCALFAVEEPLPPGRHAELASLARSGTRIVLDESLTRVEQIGSLATSGAWIVNLRVSKLGGLLRSLEVLEAARERGVAVIVGAQVGETSLLTRAALSVAHAARDLLIAQEGAFGTLLLERDVCDPSLMFGAGGRLAAPAAGAGFGLEISAGLPTRAA